MNTYDDLDGAVLAAIKREPLRFSDLLYLDSAVAGETRRIADATGRDRSRVLDGRLTAMRKRGLIKSVAQKWYIEEAKR